LIAEITEKELEVMYCRQTKNKQHCVMSYLKI